MQICEPEWISLVTGRWSYESWTGAFHLIQIFYVLSFKQLNSERIYTNMWVHVHVHTSQTHTDIDVHE